MDKNTFQRGQHSKWPPRSPHVTFKMGTDIKMFVLVNIITVQNVMRLPYNAQFSRQYDLLCCTIYFVAFVKGRCLSCSKLMCWWRLTSWCGDCSLYNRQMESRYTCMHNVLVMIIVVQVPAWRKAAVNLYSRFNVLVIMIAFTVPARGEAIIFLMINVLGVMVAVPVSARRKAVLFLMINVLGVMVTVPVSARRKAVLFVMFNVLGVMVTVPVSARRKAVLFVMFNVLGVMVAVPVSARRKAVLFLCLMYWRSWLQFLYPPGGKQFSF